MGANESALRTSAMLIVLDRRGKISSTQLDYVQTDEFKAFFEKYGSRIRKRACDLYGVEMAELVTAKSVNRLTEVVNDVEKYDCKNYRSPEIYTAVQMMITSGDTSYVQFFPKLAGYITFDSIIDAVITGNRQLYNALKEPVARIPGKSGILDPLRSATKRGQVLTLTDFSPEELGEISLLMALLSIAHSYSEDKMYILRDLIEYLQQIKMFDRKKANNTLNEMADFMSKGGLYSWDGNWKRKISDSFKYPNAEVAQQRDAYEKHIQKFVQRYPRIGFFG